MLHSQTAVSPAHPFAATHVESILRARGWLAGEATPLQLAWMADAAALLGPHCATPEALADLLALVFAYDARRILSDPATHSVLLRFDARPVIRGLAALILTGPALDSDRLKEIVTSLKSSLAAGGRQVLHPLRLALAGRAGEGELDRVVLLLDRAAALRFAVPVKSARERMLEFISALD